MSSFILNFKFGLATVGRNCRRRRWQPLRYLVHRRPGNMVLLRAEVPRTGTVGNLASVCLQPIGVLNYRCAEVVNRHDATAYGLVHLVVLPGCLHTMRSCVTQLAGGMFSAAVDTAA
jgi:hypothetical protein